jgi:FAD/FMN-containing dehydrogenase
VAEVDAKSLRLHAARERNRSLAAKDYNIQMSPVEIGLMKRIKAAFDPRGLLNPGKIFPGNEEGKTEA